jgi:proprotein convertase subtilisin/kexin type 5
MASLCHPYCTSCYGDAKSQCTVCNVATPSMLSNTTCDLACLTGYGVNSSNLLVCIQCDTNCSVCLNHPKNCTVCIAGNYLYYNGLDTLCVSICPNGTYSSSGVTNCIVCDPKCTTCSGTSTNCSSCSPGNYFYNNLCSTSCPLDHYFDRTTWSCILCSTTPNCFSGLRCPSDYFMNGNICVDVCPNYYLPALRKCIPECPVMHYLNAVNKYC